MGLTKKTAEAWRGMSERGREASTDYLLDAGYELAVNVLQEAATPARQPPPIATLATLRTVAAKVRQMVDGLDQESAGRVALDAESRVVGIPASWSQLRQSNRDAMSAIGVAVAQHMLQQVTEMLARLADQMVEYQGLGLTLEARHAEADAGLAGNRERANQAIQRLAAAADEIEDEVRCWELAFQEETPREAIAALLAQAGKEPGATIEESFSRLCDVLAASRRGREGAGDARYGVHPGARQPAHGGCGAGAG